jgi:peroxiredoxin
MTRSSRHSPRPAPRGRTQQRSQPTAPQRAVVRPAATARRLPRWLPQAAGSAIALTLLVGVVALVRAYASPSIGTPATAGGGATTDRTDRRTLAGTRPAAPDFTLATLSGTPFHLASQRGHVVVLYFMATTCGTCVQGSQDLVQALTTLRSLGAQAVAIDLIVGDTASDLRGFVQASGISASAPIVWGVDTSGAIARDYSVQVLETTVVINAQGHVAYTSAGPVPPAQLAQFVSRLP